MADSDCWLLTRPRMNCYNICLTMPARFLLLIAKHQNKATAGHSEAVHIHPLRLGCFRAMQASTAVPARAAIPLAHFRLLPLQTTQLGCTDCLHTMLLSLPFLVRERVKIAPSSAQMRLKCFVVYFSQPEPAESARTTRRSSTGRGTKPCLIRQHTRTQMCANRRSKWLWKSSTARRSMRPGLPRSSRWSAQHVRAA